jgi:hypothetical protein
MQLELELQVFWPIQDIAKQEEGDGDSDNGYI